MQKVIIMKGLQGSGKSTHARLIQAEALHNNEVSAYVIVSRDPLRAMLFGATYDPKNPAHEDLVRRAHNNLITVALLSGYNVISDDFDPDERYIVTIRDLAASFPDPGVAVEIVEREDGTSRRIYQP